MLLQQPLAFGSRENVRSVVYEYYTPPHAVAGHPTFCVAWCLLKGFCKVAKLLHEIFSSFVAQARQIGDHVYNRACLGTRMSICSLSLISQFGW